MRTSTHTPLATLAIAFLLGSCASMQVRKGDQAMALLAFSKAEQHYDKALKHIQDRELLVKAAEAEHRQNKVDEAAAHYAAAEALAPLHGEDALQYGRLLMGQGRYEQAEPLLLRALQEMPERHGLAELIGACQGYRSFYTDSSRYTIAPLELAGVASAYSPTPYPGGLLFAGQRNEGAMGNRDPWSGLSFTDLYHVSIAKDGSVGIPEALKSPVNGPYHEGAAALSADGHTLYFTRNNYYGGRKLVKDDKNISNLKLFRATLDADGNWGDIREFGANNDTYSLGLPALSEHPKRLYFTSDMPGGIGGKDLWYVEDLGTGWGQPVNMGPSINTAGDEMFPTVVGDALYFSSTGHNNMGGLDIFETHEQDDHWSEPKNMGYPINSTGDDFGMWLDSTGTNGYLSSSRSGIDRIYKLTVNPPVFALEGRVTNASTGGPLAGARITLQDRITLKDTVIQTDANGNFRFDLSPGTAYQVTAAKEDMLAQSTSLSTIGLGLSTVLHANMALNPVVIDKPIVIPNIYYDYDKWDIRPDAAVELDRVAKIFLDNPDLTFELSAHTDSRGGDTYNLVLSDARANSAVDYLIRHGVPADRLVAKGYGETMLVNHCANGVKCTEEEHQANRRTEFKVISRKTSSAH
jgi:outer membrane protein OmpA-like peptidoglycan-associated protein/tetratricopeptide (TPR) repeat protein